MNMHPQKDKDPAGTSGQVFEAKSKVDGLNSEGVGPFDQAMAAASKHIATLAARAALAGAQLARLDVDEGEPPFVLTQGAYTVRFGTDAIDELERAVLALEAPL